LNTEFIPFIFGKQLNIFGCIYRKSPKIFTNDAFKRI
jgi:hypothetical protein